jgi:catechol 2,3-dioxygenase-like lactoylglutathione lyase family enzyme
MRVALDHVEIGTDDLGKTARFYADVFRLEVCNPPRPLLPVETLWLYDESGWPIIQIRAGGSGARSGSVNHVALRCSDRSHVLDRLRAWEAEFEILETGSPQFDLVFARDPAGLLLELNFAPAQR